MSLSIVYSRGSIGISAPLVTVETHISNGLPGFTIVGLPQTCVKESKDRVRSAIINSQFEFPVRRITVNLAPAELPKEGGRFDLPIALGILLASNQITVNNITEYEFAGELALSGELRAIQGTLPFAIAAKEAKRTLILPQGNEEAFISKENNIFVATNLLAVCDHFTHHTTLPKIKFQSYLKSSPTHCDLDLSEVQGQPFAKRALEIAAAGGHSLLMIGPPGTGKTMLASRMPGIMPPLTETEALEIMTLYSINGNYFHKIQWGKRPFRAPHHTTSAIALVGGGRNPVPGEISLAHHGILFLDELPEFNSKVLEVLREPLESRTILISRMKRKIEFPARFQLIAAMNPCPCGYLGHPEKNCYCTSLKIEHYRSRISGPLLDRIDMHIEVASVQLDAIINTNLEEEKSEAVRKRVLKAVLVQRDRNLHLKLNAELNTQEIHNTKTLFLTDETKSFLTNIMQSLKLSARAYHRILKVARTIADLEETEDIQLSHLKEALSFRKLDRPIKHF